MNDRLGAPHPSAASGAIGAERGAALGSGGPRGAQFCVRYSWYPFSLGHRSASLAGREYARARASDRRRGPVWVKTCGPSWPKTSGPPWVKSLDHLRPKADTPGYGAAPPEWGFGGGLAERVMKMGLFRKNGGCEGRSLVEATWRRAGVPARCAGPDGCVILP